MNIKATLTNKSIDIFNEAKCAYKTYEAGINFYPSNNKIVGVLTAILDVHELSLDDKRFLKQKFNLIYDWNDHFVIMVKAQAVCCKVDTFNTTIGERIVESRCKAKLYYKIAKMIDSVIKNQYNAILQMKQEENRYLDHMEKEQYHINKLIK